MRVSDPDGLVGMDDPLDFVSMSDAHDFVSTNDPPDFVGTRRQQTRRKKFINGGGVHSLSDSVASLRAARW